MIVRIYRGDTAFLQASFRGYPPSGGALRVEIPWIWGADGVQIPIVMEENSHSRILRVKEKSKSE
ncbi:MAG: hypothetical protein HXX14_17315 [Bacteroidetes bacterium]|nr:hypothetical protein [Bacteroidota bacterium]